MRLKLLFEKVTGDSMTTKIAGQPAGKKLGVQPKKKVTVGYPPEETGTDDHWYTQNTVNKTGTNSPSGSYGKTDRPPEAYDEFIL